MRNTAYDAGRPSPYDPLDMASLQLWREADQTDNRETIERLLRNLPMAVTEELTERQRQLLLMRYSQGMSVSAIAREVGLHKSTVSRTISNSIGKLYRALSGTRVYLSAQRVEGWGEITVKNISRYALNVSPDELTERFVRGDSARSTEGSGLGLSIASSLTQLQGGDFHLTIDGDLFKVRLRFPISAQ